MFPLPTMTENKERQAYICKCFFIFTTSIQNGTEIYESGSYLHEQVLEVDRHAVLVCLFRKDEGGHAEVLTCDDWLGGCRNRVKQTELIQWLQRLECCGEIALPASHLTSTIIQNAVEGLNGSRIYERQELQSEQQRDVKQMGAFNANCLESQLQERLVHVESEALRTNISRAAILKRRN